MPLGKEVEVQNLNICTTTFAYRVISEGKIIYQRNDTVRSAFEEAVMRNYFDLQPFLDEYSLYLRERARRGLIAHKLYTV